MKKTSYISVCAIAVALVSCSGDKSAPPPAMASPAIVAPNYIDVAENTKDVFLEISTTGFTGGPASLSLEGRDAQWFHLDAQSGALRFRQPPDFEASLDADGSNRYQLVLKASDEAGRQATQALTVQVTNVEFDFKILSPLPNTIFEKHRHTRLPLVVWVEYDYPERLQIKANGEILQPASNYGAHWANSLALDYGDVEVAMVFWRGDEVLHTETIPVRHQYVISAKHHLAYDRVRDQVIIPHELRNEVFTLDLAAGQSFKNYPRGEVPSALRDTLYEPTSNTLYLLSQNLQRLNLDTYQVEPVVSLDHLKMQSLAYDTLSSDLLLLEDVFPSRILWTNESGSNVRAQDLDAAEHEFPTKARWLAVDYLGRRLFAAPASGQGVGIFDLDSGARLDFSMSPPQTYHLGKLLYHSAHNALYMPAPKVHGLLKFDLGSGVFSSLAQATPAMISGGNALFHPQGLALDIHRDRLLTLSASRLLAVDPDTGETSMLFDSRAGSGALSSGFSGVWIAPDGERALAFDYIYGRAYAVDLLTGDKTAMAYQTLAEPAVTYRILQAKFAPDGKTGLLHRKRTLSTEPEHLLLVSLERGSSKNFAVIGPDEQLIGFDFSTTSPHVIWAVRDHTHEVKIHLSELGSGESITSFTLPTSSTQLMALHFHNNRIYLLERTATDSQGRSAYHLSTLDSANERTLLTSYPALTTGQGGADINLLGEHTLALVLPGQRTRFWDLQNQSDADVTLESFSGVDQPRDFYALEHFREVMYLRAEAGLHICWRGRCAILAN